MPLWQSGNFVEGYNHHIWRQSHPSKDRRKRENRLILGDRDKIRNRHLCMWGAIYNHSSATMRSWGCVDICAMPLCAVHAQKCHYYGMGKGRDHHAVYRVHIAACEYEYGVTPWTILAPATGDICCLPPPPRTFNCQRVCYETLGTLKSVCGPRPIFEPSCGVKV
jgi:hypothetical protein